MKSNLKLIKSLLSLVFALFLCVSVGYAWFVINKEATVSNVTMSVIEEENGVIVFDETSSGNEENTVLIPKKRTAYDMKAKSAITNLIINIDQINPTKAEFDTYFTNASRNDLLLGDYYLKYYSNNEVVASYNYDVTNKTTLEKSTFLYQFLLNNHISNFLSIQIQFDGSEEIQDLTYDSESHNFSIAANLDAEDTFRLFITLGNDNNLVLQDNTLSNNLDANYECSNLNCYLLSKIKISFSTLSN